MGLAEMVETPTIVRGDNTAANTLYEEDIVTTGNQFIHYNKEAVAEGHVKIEYIKTDQNVADLFTKAIKKGVIRQLLDALLGYVDVFESAAKRTGIDNDT